MIETPVDKYTQQKDKHNTMNTQGTHEGDAAETEEGLEPMPSYEELQKEYEEQQEEEEKAA